MSDLSAKYREWWRKTLRDQFGPDIDRERRLYHLDRRDEQLPATPTNRELETARQTIAAVHVRHQERLSRFHDWHDPPPGYRWRRNRDGEIVGCVPR